MLPVIRLQSATKVFLYSLYDKRKSQLVNCSKKIKFFFFIFFGTYFMSDVNWRLTTNRRHYQDEFWAEATRWLFFQVPVHRDSIVRNFWIIIPWNVRLFRRNLFPFVCIRKLSFDKKSGQNLNHAVHLWVSVIYRCFHVALFCVLRSVSIHIVFSFEITPEKIVIGKLEKVIETLEYLVKCFTVDRSSIFESRRIIQQGNLIYELAAYIFQWIQNFVHVFLSST